MKLVLVLDDRDPITVDADPEMTISDLRALSCHEIGIPNLAPERIMLSYSGQQLKDLTQTLSTIGITENELLMVQVVPGGLSTPGDLSAIQSLAANLGRNRQSRSRSHNGNSSRSRRSPPDPETLRQQLILDPGLMAYVRDRNPELAEVVQDERLFRERFDRFQQTEMAERDELERLERQAAENPFDPDVQQRINELIQQKNRDRALEHAIEYMPELFGHVFMLYINVTINGHPVKAFVDSGAQSTIMSVDCAKKCNVDRLIDLRFSGIARGVGTQKIVGRIQMVQMQIDDVYVATSFSVLEDQQMDILLGLDMLRRHQCCIDLKRNVLVIGSASEDKGHEVAARFLSENELPDYARLNSVTGLPDEEMLPPEALAPNPSASSATPNQNNASASASALSPSASASAAPPRAAAAAAGLSAERRAAVERLMRQFSNQMPRENVQQALEAAGWNEEVAVSKLMQQMVQSINFRPPQSRH